VEAVAVKLHDTVEVDVEDGEYTHGVARLWREEQAEHPREQREHLVSKGFSNSELL
jgi:hypothetical protein